MAQDSTDMMREGETSVLPAVDSTAAYTAHLSRRDLLLKVIPPAAIAITLYFKDLANARVGSTASEDESQRDDLFPIRSDSFAGYLFLDGEHDEPSLLTEDVVTASGANVLLSESSNPSSQIQSFSEQQILGSTFGDVWGKRSDVRLFSDDVLLALARNKGVIVLAADGIGLENLSTSVEREVRASLLGLSLLLLKVGIKLAPEAKNKWTKAILSSVSKGWGDKITTMGSLWGVTRGVKMGAQMGSDLIPDDANDNDVKNLLSSVNEFLRYIPFGDISVFWRTILDLVRGGVVANSPDVLAYLGGGSEGESRLLVRMGPDHLMGKYLANLPRGVLIKMLCSYPAIFLRSVVNYNGGLQDFCTVYVVPVRENIFGPDSVSKIPVFDEKLFTALQGVLEPGSQ